MAILIFWNLAIAALLYFVYKPLAFIWFIGAMLFHLGKNFGSEQEKLKTFTKLDLTDEQADKLFDE